MEGTREGWWRWLGDRDFCVKELQENRGVDGTYSFSKRPCACSTLALRMSCEMLNVLL